MAVVRPRKVRVPGEQLVIVCKTFEHDLRSFVRLFDSVVKHNKDAIPFYVSVPDADVDKFTKIVGKDAVVLSDESYAAKYFTDKGYWGLTSGYVNQEICKLSFWENNLARNYLFVDSDAYFIRDFYRKDFMADEDTPYSVLAMDKELNTESFYREFGKYRMGHIKRIFDEVGNSDARLLTCHGMTVMNAEVLEDFKRNFMQKRKLDYKALIEISPYEYTWYNAWLQKCRVIEVMAVEPFFRTFHMRTEYIFSRLRLVSQKDIAEQYVGVIMNSNWKPKSPPARYRDPGIVIKVMNKVIERVF